MGAREILLINLGVKRGERVLVLVDKIAVDEVLENREIIRRDSLLEIASDFLLAGKELTNTTLEIYPSLKSSASEPPEKVWRTAFGENAVNKIGGELLGRLINKTASADDYKIAEQIINEFKENAVDVVVAVSNFSTSHTRFRDFLTRITGCRYASMPVFDKKMFEGPMTADWEEVGKISYAMVETLKGAVKVNITAPNGTNINLYVENRPFTADTGLLHKKGSFGNLPAGEVYLAPLENRAEGKMVFDWAPTKKLTPPLVVTVKDGYVENLAGNDQFADFLASKIKKDKNFGNIAELGIGTNPKAERPDNILEAEKILGTVHIALGDNSSFGGNIKVPFHQDFVFFSPTLTAFFNDGREIKLIQDGKITGIDIER